MPRQVIDVLLEDKRRRPTGGPRRMSQLMLMSSTNHSFHASRQSRDPSSTADPQIAENDDQNTDTRDSASTNPWRQSTSGGNPLLLSRGRSAMPSILIDNDTAPDTAKSRGVSTSGANEPNTPAGVTSRLRSPLLSRLSMLRAATVAAPPHLTYRDVQRLSTYHKNVSILFTDIQVRAWVALRTWHGGMPGQGHARHGVALYAWHSMWFTDAQLCGCASVACSQSSAGGGTCPHCQGTCVRAVYVHVGDHACRVLLP